ncbi:hypothetical protein WMY93_031881, partial [Mugilogobius chulae]
SRRRWRRCTQRPLVLASGTDADPHTAPWHSEALSERQRHASSDRSGGDTAQRFGGADGTTMSSSRTQNPHGLKPIGPGPDMGRPQSRESSRCTRDRAWPSRATWSST